MKESLSRHIETLLLCCIVMCVGALSCTKETLFDGLTPDQRELIGTGVDFSASISELFETKASYANSDGDFSVGDQLTIYRQYWTGSAFGEEEYRQYKLEQKTATGTSIYVGEPKWVPIAGRLGGKWDAATSATVTFTQTAADSLTWNDDRTVRFRAVGRSNYANIISNTDKTKYYPDFTISDWVTVSGPTSEIPFTMKHLGSRIQFSAKEGGNLVQKVEICIDDADYERDDNSTDAAHDASDKILTDEHGNAITAAQAAANVRAVYDRMCLPAGVDIETGLFTTMTKAFYNSATDFSTIVDTPSAMVKYGVRTSSEIAADVQRPVFTSRLYGGRLFFVTIPYDMSNESTGGEPLVLPPYTRFKVWMYDVNNGDKISTDRDEGTYHIFSLSDVSGSNFSEGMEFAPGKSFDFTVGYVYDRLTVEVAPSFQWVEENLSDMSGSSEASDPSLSQTPYSWWKTAIDNAITSARADGGNYNPEFHITSRQQFLEFINLVNGTAATKTSGLEQAYREIYDTNGQLVSSGYWWYTGINSDGEYQWTTREAMEAEGYIFFNQYYQSVGDIGSESRETYLKGPFSFYDSGFNMHFSVKLDCDLDMDDWPLESIGKTAASAFSGSFDGQNHSITNLYMKDKYLFGNIEGADIRNLVLVSSDTLALVNSARGANYIAGISLKADCSASSIANSIIGLDDMGRKNTSYVVGCIHEGKSGAAMVGKADNLYMYGCMETGEGIPAGGALLGQYYDDNDKFFSPQKGRYAEWGRFMCNYYNTELSPGTRATSEPETNVKYQAQEYIRGAKSHVLKAVKDYLIPDDLPYEKLSDKQRIELYGLAPWKAMNYGIYMYNSSSVGALHPCTMHYMANTTGYSNRYPSLLPAAPTSAQYANVLEQNN